MPTAGPRSVAILIDSLLGGGAERVAVDAARSLDPARYVPHLLVTRSSGPLEALVREHELACTILDRRRRLAPRAFRRACAIVRSCDLLHAHKFEGSMWGALIARATGRPLVAHEHTYDGRGSRLRTLGYRWWIAPTARKIVCVSTSVAASLLAEGVPAGLIETVPNAVPADDALPRGTARRELGLAPQTAVVGMIGRLRPEKRHELALEALARLRSTGREVELCVVGDGPRRAELCELAARLGVSESVHWAGERAHAGRLVRAFDASLLCSSYEGMPLAALEALVAGVPLVATAVGSLPELLANGEGRLVPSGDVTALTDALAAALETQPTPADTARLVARARARYGLERLAEDLARVYDEALARAGAA